MTKQWICKNYFIYLMISLCMMHIARSQSLNYKEQPRFYNADAGLDRFLILCKVCMNDAGQNASYAIHTSIDNFYSIITAHHERDFKKNPQIHQNLPKHLIGQIKFDELIRTYYINIKNPSEQDKKCLSAAHDSIKIQEIVYVGLTMLSNKENCVEARLLGLILYKTLEKFAAVLNRPFGFEFTKFETRLLRFFELLNEQGAIKQEFEKFYLEPPDRYVHSLETYECRQELRDILKNTSDHFKKKNEERYKNI